MRILGTCGNVSDKVGSNLLKYGLSGRNSFLAMSLRVMSPTKRPKDITIHHSLLNTLLNGQIRGKLLPIDTDWYKVLPGKITRPIFEEPLNTFFCQFVFGSFWIRFFHLTYFQAGGIFAFTRSQYLLAYLKRDTLYIIFLNSAQYFWITLYITTYITKYYFLCFLRFLQFFVFFTVVCNWQLFTWENHNDDIRLLKISNK